MAQVNDLSRSLTAFDPISTLVLVVEMSKAKWLVSGAVPGVERQPAVRQPAVDRWYAERQHGAPPRRRRPPRSRRPPPRAAPRAPCQ